MTTWSYSFVWLSFLFVGHIAKQGNGEVSPPWITKQGCYETNPQFGTKYLSQNGPTSCFNECENFTHIGIQANMCACLENMPSSPRIPYFRCLIQSQSTQHMLVYSKVIVLPTTINQAEYGNVYVSILPTSNFEFHASNSSSEVHGVCYEDGQMKCKCVTAAENAESARRKGLISYNDFGNACPMVAGSYWIGMFRDSPVYSSTALSTPSTSTSRLPSSSTQPRFQTSDKMSFPQSVENISSTITQTSSGYQTRDVTTTSLYGEGTSYHQGNPGSTLKIIAENAEGNPDTPWKSIAAAFISVSLVLLISTIVGIVAFLRKKKENQISHTDPDNIIKQARASTIDHRGDPGPSDGNADNVETDNRSHTNLSLRKEQHPVIEGNHVLGEEAKHITPFQVVQSDKTLQDIENPKKRRHHRRSRRQQEKDVTNSPDTVEDHIPESREKKRKHSKSHHHHEHTGANNLSDNAMEKGQEIYRKKRKHRKPHVHAETDDTNLSDTALEHSLLDIVEDENRKRKERRKNKKRKKNQDNYIEESEGVNVS